MNLTEGLRPEQLEFLLNTHVAADVIALGNPNLERADGSNQHMMTWKVIGLGQVTQGVSRARDQKRPQD